MTTFATAAIEADPTLPIIRITRDFAATPYQLFRAHVDPDLFLRWVGPNATSTRITQWDARTGGSWSYVAENDGNEFGFRGMARMGHEIEQVQWRRDRDFDHYRYYDHYRHYRHHRHHRWWWWRHHHRRHWRHHHRRWW